MDYDKLSALFKERDELKDIQHKINDNNYVLTLYYKGTIGYIVKIFKDSYKSILNTTINAKLSDIEYKIEEALKESLV